MAVSASGTIYALGAQEVDSTYIRSSFLVRMNLSGNIIWRREFHFTGGLDPSDLLILPNDNIVLGLMESYPAWDSRLIVVDPDGNTLLSRIYPSTKPLDYFHKIELLGNGNLLCKGRDSTLREYLPNGDLVQSYFAGQGIQGAFQAADGGIILFGNPDNDVDFYVQKLYPDPILSAWTLQWEKTYALPNLNFITGIVETPSGDLVMAGSQGTNVFGTWNGLLIRTDCEGNIANYAPCLPPPSAYTLFPNPNSGFATLAIPEDVAASAHTVQVFNALGQEVLAVDTQNEDYVDMDLSHVQQGVYFLRVLRAGKAVWDTRWVVQR